MSDERLLVVITDSAGQRWFHRSRWRTLTVGRSEACELQLSSSRVSRRHVHITAQDHALTVVDLGSAGGTWVDGLRVEGRTPAPDGVVLEVGPFLLEVFLSGEPPGDAEPWVHVGGTAAPAPPPGAPLTDDEEALSFAELIRWAQVRPLPLQLCCALGLRLLDEIQRLHAAGRLAYTLPPGWIWVGRSGALAYRPEAPPELCAGDEHDQYTSPELIERPDADVRSDVFAVGILLYELLCGRHPFQDAGKKAGTLPLRGPIPDPVELRSDVPRALSELLGTALEACPDDRFPSVQAFRRELMRLIDQGLGPEASGAELHELLEPCFQEKAPVVPTSSSADDAGSDAPFLLRIEAIDDAGEKVEATFPGHGEISVGRHHTNDLVLLSLRMSRRHARFLVEGGRILLEDLGSANGTYVNGQKVRRPTPVAISDRIELGGVRLTLGVDEAPAPHLFLVVSPGEGEVRRVVLHGRPKVTVGRADDVDVKLDHDAVAARHCRLIVWGDRLQVEDLGSPAGTEVSGARVEGTRLLQGEDALRIGPYTVRAALDRWPDDPSDRKDTSPMMVAPIFGDPVEPFGQVGTRTVVHRGEGGLPCFRSRFERDEDMGDVTGYQSAVRALRERHAPALYPVVGGGFDEDGPWLDRPCLPGATLAGLVAGPLPLDVLVALGEGVLDGVRAWLDAPGPPLASGSPLRAELRPEAVFLRADGRVLWMAPQLCPPRLPETPDEVFGLAPERAGDLDAPLDEKALLFGVGSLLYRAATGRAPFGRDRVEDALDALAHEKPLDPRELVASTPVELVRLLAGLLEKDPALRIESVEQTLIELRALRLPVRPDALPARMALREWLKGALLPSRRSLEGDGFHEVTAEYDLPGTLTDEGPNASDG